MLSRPIIARLMLLGAAVSAVATDRPVALTPDVTAAGPSVVIQSGEVATATVHVDFLGEELPGPSQLSLRFEPVAGRRPGNPELTARLFDAATGDELIAWSDRSPFHVPWRFACDATTDCGQTCRFGCP